MHDNWQEGFHLFVLNTIIGGRKMGLKIWVEQGIGKRARNDRNIQGNHLVK